MAYVPRYVYDVFVSYAHLDERTPDGGPGWVSRFAGALDVALSQELGEQAIIWLDSERLTAGFRLSEKVRYDLSRTSIVVRVESPSFWRSGYCAEESDWFTQLLELDPLVFAGRSRLIRAEIRPTPGVADSDDIVVRLHHDGKRLEPEQAAARISPDLATLLRDMEAARPPIYIPRPSIEDLESDAAWATTVGELKACNYRFTPRTLVVEDDTDVRDAIGGARLVVLVIGANAARRDPLKRLGIAIEHSRPLIVWISPRATTDASPEQRALLASLRSGAGPYELLEKASVETLKERIRAALAPAAASPLAAIRAVAEGASRPRTVYLICDPRDRKSGAWNVKRAVEDEGFEVLLPEMGGPDAQTLNIEHLRRLRSADRVLLYYRSATKKWFEQHWRELCDETLQWGRRGACLVAPPDKHRWIAEAEACGFANVPSDKVLVTDDSLAGLQPFLREAE